MPTTTTLKGQTIIDPEGIELYRMATLKAGLKLEVLGMHRRGKSIFSIVKKEYNLKGEKRKVLEEFTKLYNERKQKYLEGDKHENVLES